MEKKVIEHLKQTAGIEYQINAVLKNYCWYRIGGEADLLVYPNNKEQLTELITVCLNTDTPYFIMGSGANILISDNGFRGVVIKLSKCFADIEKDGNIVSVGAGVQLDRLVLFCEEYGLAGMAELAGIPGTLGGALTMNAGTDKGVIGDFASEVDVIDTDLNCATLENARIGFGYRSAPLLQDKIICRSRLTLEEGNSITLKEIRLKQLQLRKERQPLNYPSCGSVFKRPPGDFAGRLIEAAGLKGFRYGNAQISDKHAGFIVNLGNARAEDVKYLMDKIQDDVYKKFNVKLEPEVRLLGF